MNFSKISSQILPTLQQLLRSVHIQLYIFSCVNEINDSGLNFDGLVLDPLDQHSQKSHLDEWLKILLYLGKAKLNG